MALRAGIVNSRLGAWARAARDAAELHLDVIRSRETVGTTASDSLARQLLERLCREGCVFVDVGAHIGSVVDGVGRYSRPSRIVAVEAIPAKADALRRRFPRAVVHCCAVGEEAGEARFFVAEGASGFSSLDRTLSQRASGVREIVVPVATLDSLVPGAEADVVKIDVEGAELGVLRGAEALVAASRPSILFESGPESMAAYPKEAIWRWCEAHDYAVIVPNRLAHFDPGLSLEGFLEAHLYPRRTTNYWAVARERRDEMRLRARAVLGLA